MSESESPDAVRAAITVILKDAGVEFMDGDEPGVKLKRPTRYEGFPIRSAQRRKRRVIPARMYANSPLVLPGSSRVSPHHGVSGGWIRPHARHTCLEIDWRGPQRAWCFPPT